jgi:hypothetical protein
MEFISEKNKKIYGYDQLISSNSIRLFIYCLAPQGVLFFGALRSVELAEDADTAPGFTALSYSWVLPFRSLRLFGSMVHLSQSEKTSLKH